MFVGDRTTASTSLVGAAAAFQATDGQTYIDRRIPSIEITSPGNWMRSAVTQIHPHMLNEIQSMLQ